MPVSAAETGLVRLGANLDARNVAQMRLTLNALLDATEGTITLDMRALEFIDPAGLAMLTAAHRRAERAGRQLVLLNCSRDIRRVLTVTHLNRVLHLDRGLELSA